MENDDDKRLLARVARGQTQAMRLLYERHHSALYAFIISRGSDGTAAEDVLHDTMLDVWRLASRYRGAASVRTWIFSIARNKQVDRVKGSARLTLVAEMPDTVDAAPNAETVIEASQDAEKVRACLDKLKNVQRTAIRLAFYEDLSYEEIAEIEDVPAGTIKSRIFHAKQALIRCLGQSGDLTIRAAKP